MNYEWALQRLDEGGAARRDAWQSNGDHIRKYDPTATSDMDLAYLYISDSDGVKQPWQPTVDDEAAGDWVGF